MRFGQEAEVLAWGMVFLFQPISCVFYPIEVLPNWLQAIAWANPAAHVFEGMRIVLNSATLPLMHLGWAVGLNLLEGRGFTEGDRESSIPVAIISEKLAKMYWPGESPIGQHIKLGSPNSDQPWLTVVGVVNNVEYDWTDNAPEKAIYVPYRQSPPVFTYLAVRTNGDAHKLAASIGHELASIDPVLTASDARTLERLLFGSLGGLFEIGGLMTVLGMIGLCVAVVGVYGVMVLGASRRAVLRHVLGHGIWLTLIGVGVGLTGAIVLTRLVSSFFFGVEPTDAVTFLTVTLLLAFAAFVACYIPARQAMKVDPMVALRHE